MLTQCALCAHALPTPCPPAAHLFASCCSCWVRCLLPARRPSDPRSSCGHDSKTRCGKDQSSEFSPRRDETACARRQEDKSACPPTEPPDRGVCAGLAPAGYPTQSDP